MVHIMISMDELKPILEPLIEGREDSASIIESIQGIDRPAEEPDFSAREAEINKSWNDRFMKAFFGEKGKELDTEIPKDEVVEASEATDEIDGSEEITPENITIDDLFEEKIIE